MVNNYYKEMLVKNHYWIIENPIDESKGRVEVTVFDRKGNEIFKGCTLYSGAIFKHLFYEGIRKGEFKESLVERSAHGLCICGNDDCSLG